MKSDHDDDDKTAKQNETEWRMSRWNVIFISVTDIILHNLRPAFQFFSFSFIRRSHKWWCEMWDDSVISLMRLWNFNDIRVALRDAKETKSFLVRDSDSKAFLKLSKDCFWLHDTELLPWKQKNNHRDAWCHIKKKMFHVASTFVKLSISLMSAHWLFSWLIGNHFSYDSAISLFLGELPLIHGWLIELHLMLRQHRICIDYSPLQSNHLSCSWISYLASSASSSSHPIFTFFKLKTHLEKIS